MPDLVSPDGRLAVRLDTADVGKERAALFYHVTHDGRPVLQPSRLGLWLGGAADAA